MITFMIMRRRATMVNLATCWVNTLRPRRNGRHFADDTFRLIFLNENVKTATKFSLMFVPRGPINIIPALVQIMAWRRPGDKPLSEPMMVRLLTHLCVTRPQWVKQLPESGLWWLIISHISIKYYYTLCSSFSKRSHCPYRYGKMDLN